jgi:hypothetical protein
MPTGLAVYAWAFCNENNFLPLDFGVGNPSDPGFTSDSTVERSTKTFRLSTLASMAFSRTTAVDARRRFDR